METVVTQAPQAAVEYAAHADETKDAVEYLFGPFRFIPARRTLLRDGVPQRLGGRAFDILTVLLERAGEPVGKRELIGRVWPSTVVEDGNLKVHVAALRRMLDDVEPGANYIATINGRGYCFAAPVRVVRMPAASPAPGRVFPARPHGVAGNREATTTALVDLLLRQRLAGFIGPDSGNGALGLCAAGAGTSPGGTEVCFADLDALIQERLSAVLWQPQI